jgi:hypothetical protein
MLAATFIATVFIPMFFVLLSTRKAKAVPSAPERVEERPA